MLPTHSRRTFLALGAVFALSACGGARTPAVANFVAPTSHDLNPGETPELRRLIMQYSREYQMPESLIHRMVKRESGYNPGARNGPYYGLLQIHPKTARTMGYTGTPEGLLDAETNLKYAGKYLRGAWLVSDGSTDRAEMWYSKGYYYEAKRRGLLAETGLAG